MLRDDELLKLGSKQSEIDKTAFRWYNNNKLEGVLIIHVDDFLCSWNESLQTRGDWEVDNVEIDQMVTLIYDLERTTMKESVNDKRVRCIRKIIR